MADKSPQAFRTIREVADWLGVEAHVLRFWESKFSQIKPVKRAGGRRYYRPADMQLVGGIKVLLHDEGMTIRGAQKLLREQGIAHVAALSPSLDEDDTASLAPPIDGDAILTSAEETDSEESVSEAVDTPADNSMGEEAPAPEMPEMVADEQPSQPNAPEATSPVMTVAADDAAEAAPETADDGQDVEQEADLAAVSKAASESETPTESPLSELRKLLHAAAPLTDAQRHALARLYPRIEAHAARLRARHAAE